MNRRQYCTLKLIERWGPIRRSTLNVRGMANFSDGLKMPEWRELLDYLQRNKLVKVEKIEQPTKTGPTPDVFTITKKGQDALRKIEAEAEK